MKVYTLNYAPGPLDTDMQAELRSSSTLDSESREWFIKMKEDGKLVDCAASAEKCVRLALSESSPSGSHVDYFDKE